MLYGILYISCLVNILPKYVVNNYTIYCLSINKKQVLYMEMTTSVECDK